MRLFAVVAAVLLPLVAAAAEPGAGDLQRAKAHYEAGSGLYQLGRYDEAIREFSAGYALSHRPQFTLNIAQCYRQLGRLDDARDMLRRFLDEAPPDAPERAAATALLAETEQQLRARAATAPPPPSAPPPNAAAATAPPSAVAAAPPPPNAAAATAPPSAVAATPPPRDVPRKSHRGAWIALGVVGGVLVVGAAVAIGVVAAHPTETVPSTALGTVRF